MARSPFERRRPRQPRGRAAAALAALLLLAAGLQGDSLAASLSGTLKIDGENFQVNLRDDSWSLEKVTLLLHGPETQGTGEDTRVTAQLAKGEDKPDGVTELDLTGRVHIEFRDAVLDADSALMQIRGQELLSVQVRGEQAQFSHQLRKDRQISGRADSIDYDSATGRVRFRGNTFWTDGRRTELSTEEVIYNLDDGSAFSPTPGTGVIRPDLDAVRERIPTPRTPERSSAQ